MVQHPGRDDSVELAVRERQLAGHLPRARRRRAPARARPCAARDRRTTLAHRARRCIRSASSPRPPPTSSTRRGCHASIVRRRDLLRVRRALDALPQGLARPEIRLGRILLAHDGLDRRTSSALSPRRRSSSRRRAANGSGTASADCRRTATSRSKLGTYPRRPRSANSSTPSMSSRRMRAKSGARASPPVSRENVSVDGPLPTSSRNSSRWKREFVDGDEAAAGPQARARALTTPRSRSGTW